jgi:hypothetical protein
LGGKTPHEGFEKVKPHLGHLREIGCRAFVLIKTYNLKAFARSIECVLIGYTPNCKAYRCWQRSTGKIFNSGNVRFIETGQTEEVHYDTTLLAKRLARPSVATDASTSVLSDQSAPDPAMSTSPLPTINDPVAFVDPPSSQCHRDRRDTGNPCRCWGTPCSAGNPPAGGGPDTSSPPSIRAAAHPASRHCPTRCGRRRCR